jgi:hypothetical protein
MRYPLVWAVGFAACVPPGTVESTSPHPVRDSLQRAALLEVGHEVRGSTEEPTPYAGAICTGGGTAGKRSAVMYRFVPPETATYMFTTTAEYPAVIEVAMAQLGPQENRPIVCGGGSLGKNVVRATLRAGETYGVTVDGLMQRQGAYTLAVARDTSATARIQPEQPQVVSGLLASSQLLATGTSYGVYESLAGGLRAACGGLGSGTVYRLDVKEARRLAIRAIAQFPIAMELRARDGTTSIGCARGTALDHFAATLDDEVGPGSYLVIDTTDLTPDLFDAITRSPIDVKTPGAGVHAAFVLEVAP